MKLLGGSAKGDRHGCRGIRLATRNLLGNNLHAIRGSSVARAAWMARRDTRLAITDGAQLAHDLDGLRVAQGRLGQKMVEQRQTACNGSLRRIVEQRRAEIDAIDGVQWWRDIATKPRS
uniref:Uncharacterized protein n=1 Tax=Cucumis melo TaxID=3656 RepID=A0A9I9DLJ4_CUCME